jgi:hypothetical protein
MFANGTRLTFTLRSVFIGVAVLSVVCAALRMVWTTAVSLRVKTPEDCLVYLDDRPIGRGVNFAVSHEEALQWGFPWSGEIRYELTPHGLYLLDMQDETGHVPLLHLRPMDGDSSSRPTIFLDEDRQKQVILLRLATIIDRKIDFRPADPLPKNQIEHAVRLIEERTEDSARKFDLCVTIVPEVQQLMESHGGFRLGVIAISLSDGRNEGQYWTFLKKTQNEAEHRVEMQVPMQSPSERFVLYFMVDGYNHSLLNEEKWQPFLVQPLPVRRAAK